MHENKAPDGYNPMPDYYVSVDGSWTEPAAVILTNIPDHYEFKKTDSSGEPLEGVKFRLEDEDGNELGTYTSDKDGIVSFAGLKPGTYFIKEIETLEGFTLSGEVIKVKLDEYYVVPEKMRTLINYTTIQTGVNLAVTGIMWAGLGLMAVSGTVGLVRKRRQKKNI